MFAYMDDGRSLPRSLARLVAAWELDPPGRLLGIADIATRAEVGPEHARVLAQRLVERGWLARVSRGKFEFVPGAMGYPSGSEWSLLVGVRVPMVISGLTAARHRGLSPQLATRHIAVVPQGATIPRPLARSTRFRVARLVPWRVFGSELVERDGVAVPMALLGRLLIDAIEHAEWFGGIGEAARVLARGLPHADRAVLLNDAARWRSGALCQRLGWWGDRVFATGWDKPERRRLELMGGAKPVRLLRRYDDDAAAPTRTDPRWRVIVDVADDVLEMEMGVR
jgi:predicted transcriptional regulator of viral defense system